MSPMPCSWFPIWPIVGLRPLQSVRFSRLVNSEQTRRRSEAKVAVYRSPSASMICSWKLASRKSAGVAGTGGTRAAATGLTEKLTSPLSHSRSTPRPCPLYCRVQIRGHHVRQRHRAYH